MGGQSRAAAVFCPTLIQSRFRSWIESLGGTTRVGGTIESLGGTDVRMKEENTGGGGAADNGSGASGGGASGDGAADSGSAADGADEADGDKESDKKEENGNEGSVVRIVTLV
jgi:hypothetical protein